MERIDSKSAIKEMDRFEQAINDLRVKYDRYFFGLERRAPEDNRKKLDKWARRLLNYFMSNTQLRFRRETLIQRFNSYARMWDRVCAQIEAGTYKPDQMKADRRIGKFEARDMLYKKPDVAPPKTEPETPAPKQPPQPTAPSKPSAAEKLFRQYVKAREKLGQPTSITADKFETMLNKQIKQIQKKHGYSKIELRVAVEGDKVKIKGTPKK